MQEHSKEVFSGEWTYRSIINRVEPAATLDDIILAEGQLLLKVNEAGVFIESTLSFGEDYPMLVQGGVVDAGPGAPPTAKFTAYGIPKTKTEGWVYSYIGSPAPTWPYGIDQRAAIVGTVTRVLDHGATSKAGYVASFVAVKH